MIKELIEKYLLKRGFGSDVIELYRPELYKMLEEHGEASFNAGREHIRKMDGISMKYVDYNDYLTYDE